MVSNNVNNNLRIIKANDTRISRLFGCKDISSENVVKITKLKIGRKKKPLRENVHS